ncbi:MAG: HAD-IIA family hydrolase [Candidatus Nanopelagicales bacterium]
MKLLAHDFDVALLDLDGVVYIGDEPVPGAAQGLAAARRHGMALTFVTNNASRPPDVVAAHLTDLGVPAAALEVVTSSQAGAALLAQRLDPSSTVLAVGGPGVALALEAVGLVPLTTEQASVRTPAAVLQGFGREVTWVDLAAAAVAVERGAYWVATNPDATLPVPGGRAPGNGALVAAVATAVGRGPDDIAGKPYPALMRASIERTAATRPLVVGDRLDTDIAGAHAVGVPSLLVLTGVTDVRTLLEAVDGERPDYLGADLSALTQAPSPTRSMGGAGPQREGGIWRCGASSAWVHDRQLAVEIGEGEWLGALQCACAAAWSADTDIDVQQAAGALETARRGRLD